MTVVVRRFTESNWYPTIISMRVFRNLRFAKEGARAVGEVAGRSRLAEIYRDPLSA